ncbi:hypothetical protein ACFVAV_22570 [Nocardia sp. NPDC057663]|uniref:hypothetical protein n=1 Tax=Nocardia sp. NPDC057663 TaxID=3346201 RepID=UPI0036722CB1
MTTRARRTTIRIVALGSMLASIVGCSNEKADLGSMAACGQLVFPADTKLREYKEDTFFNDQASTAVVEIPSDKIAEFKRESALDRFMPGVPSSWKQYWSDAELLGSSTGSEHSDEQNRADARWVVIHDLGTGTNRVLVRAAC